MLTVRQVEDVCLSNWGTQQCRYLAESQGNFVCLKMAPQRASIDEEVRDFGLRSHAQDVNDAPLGNNCRGYLLLQTKLQGFDVI